MKTFIVLSAVIAVAFGNSLICRNYQSGALLPNPENCAEFFMCRPGRAVKFTCPAYTQYNPVIQACDPTLTVRCKPGKLPVDIEYTPIDAEPSVILHTNTACINKPIAMLIPKQGDCNTFYQCSPTGVIAFKCPAGTLFDTNRKYCERSDIASCSTFLPVQPPTIPILPPVQPGHPSQPIVPPIMIEDPVQAQCLGQREGLKVRHPSSCFQYIQCSTLNRSQVFNCPSGTAFDPIRSVCDWERNVQCMY